MDFFFNNLIHILMVSTVFLPLCNAEEFDYDPSSEFGPQNWAELDIENNQCGGMRQSGINIVSSSCNEYDSPYIFNAGTCTTNDLTFSMNDHVIRVDFNANACTPPSMTIPNIQNGVYDVLQYHIHSGSDHTIDGQNFGADMHIVHRNRVSGATDLAVLGLFIEPTNDVDSNLFDVLISGIEEVTARTKEECSLRRRLPKRKMAEGTLYNPYDKLPSNSSMYFYAGSLTTPPCTEIVTWNVVDQPISISVREYLTITNLILNFVDPETCTAASISSPSGYTARPTQPLNGRTVLRKCPFAEVEEKEPRRGFFTRLFNTLFGRLF